MTNEQVHITKIKAGDTIYHNGKLVTVATKDIKHSDFMGRTIFGDSYHLGNKPVLRVLL
ncbi:hypothetical protein [Vibrio sp. THAF190c]|jgi:tartrate dehydratase beta subunit/fumarate hydratase class I family protein|uniref:hypothetical protein n=1 Tax=Vibrio sp. THAF190c TaxID=2587865 RepID=UPI0012A9834E|nr:hypothetical protein [Vibrio sp. THAF190c]QFT13308.1 hypothetical protein FIV04_25495 [Vibrio sp. THAF190c]